MDISPAHLPTGKAGPTQKLEWRVCRDDAAWEAAQHTLATEQPPTMLVKLHHLWHRGRLHALILIVLLGLSGGWWAWQRAEAGVAQIETELAAAVTAELWHDDLALPRAATSAAVDASTTVAGPLRPPGEIISHVEIRDLGADWAVVDVTLQRTNRGPRYHQTRVYHVRAHSWERADATAAHWGTPRQWESEHFIFAYYAVDEAAVRAAAPKLDMLYRELQTYAEPTGAVEALRPVVYAAYPHQPPRAGAWGAATAMFTATPQKRTIIVDPAQPLGIYYTGSAPERNMAMAEIVMASPAAMLLPEATAPGDVLVQALLLELYNRQALNSFAVRPQPGQWFRLNNATRLWFIWEQDLPLAIWRKPLVQWVFDVTPATSDGDANGAPDFAQQLCEHHELWLRSPLEVAVPILCWHDKEGESMTSAWQYHAGLHDYSLNTLLYASAAKQQNAGVPQDVLLLEPGPYAIVLATLLEYVATSYGTDQVRALLAAIPAHATADTLIPAHFGVPLAEFEQRWRAFLVENYALAK